MLRAFGIEPARLMRRAAHQEFARRDAHHLRAFRTFLEFAVRCFGRLPEGCAARELGRREGR